MTDPRMFQDMTGTEHDWISQNRQDGKKGNKEDGGKEGGRQGGGGLPVAAARGLRLLATADMTSMFLRGASPVS